MKYASIALIVAFLSLSGYEVWALATDSVTLSRLFWITEVGNYGLLLPVIFGLLAGHFVLVSIDTMLAFFYGFVAAGLFWHIVKSTGVKQP